LLVVLAAGRPAADSGGHQYVRIQVPVDATGHDRIARPAERQAMAKDKDDNGKEPSRRGFIVSIAAVGGGVVAGGLAGKKLLAGGGDAAAATTRPANQDEIVKALLDGNQRFGSGNPIHPRMDATTRAAQLDEQAPWAAVLTCSDSMVAPEQVFDQGIGDLYVVRNAGNIASADAVASLAWAVDELEIEAIIVMGHEQCAAVKTSIETIDKGTDPGERKVIVDALRPAVSTGKDEDAVTALHDAVTKNVHLVAASLPTASATISKRFYAKKLLIQPAVYDGRSGFISML
jgi:carbonic anhydrase